MPVGRRAVKLKIFPAYAGVNPRLCATAGCRQYLPRVCGGEPGELLTWMQEFKSSPRMRG